MDDVFTVYGAHVDLVRNRGPVVTYGVNDMVLDNWASWSWEGHHRGNRGPFTPVERNVSRLQLKASSSEERFSMYRASILAAGLIALTSVALAGRPVTEDERTKLAAAVAAQERTGGKMAFDDGKFEVMTSSARTARPTIAPGP